MIKTLLTTLLLSSYAVFAAANESKSFHYPNNAKYAISISFDDARHSQVDIGLPILEKHNVNATFYLMPYHMQARLKQWRAVANAGHDIANHTNSHLCTGNFRWLREQNLGLEQVDLNFLASDIQTAQDYIFQHTGVLPSGFAYPCGQTFVGRGENVKSYVPLIAKSFKHGRTWNDETANDPLYFDSAQVRAFNIDNKSFEQIVALIENAQFEHAWIVLAGHEVGDHGPYTIKRQALDKLLHYLTRNPDKYWLAPVSSVIEHISSKTKDLER